MATTGSGEQVRVLAADGDSPLPMADCRRPVASGATPVCFLVGVNSVFPRSRFNLSIRCDKIGINEP
jgi:hypothetical protein